ncbi:Glutamate receptor 1.1 [Dorcoceras hygrometricum]|uniref:Glutamate receptor n=1 Tax=Dorcoceras hygrometricum TaxID=472368 RepID=A0A2Z7CUR2_9LAMI|nr:Glutamate receptor 1.1 [Dorcoceras hygrometricum]
MGGSALILYVLFVILCCHCGQLQVSQKKLDGIQPHYGGIYDIDVGVIVDLGTWEGKVVHSCIKMAISDFYDLHSMYKTRVRIHIRDSKGDSLQSTAAALYLLENVKVHAVIVPKISNGELFLAKLCDKARVPVLSFSFTSSSLEEHPYFFQISEDETTQFHAIVSIMETFKWRSCAFFYEDNAEARIVQSYSNNILQDNRMDVSHHTAIFLRAASDDQNIRKELHKLLKMKNSIMILHLPPSLASRVFANAQRLGMMSEGFAWIVTTKTMNFFTSSSSLLDYASMQGVVGIKPYIPPSSRLQNFTLRWRIEFKELIESNTGIQELNIFGLWAYDAVWALTEAVERAGLTPYPNQVQSNLLDLAHLWTSVGGPSLVSKIATSDFTGLTGSFRLANRKLVQDAYEVVNVIGKGERRVGFWTSALGVSKDMIATNKSSPGSSLETIIWPGISLTTPGNRLVLTSGRSLRVGIPALNPFGGFVTSHHDEQLNVTTFDGLSVEVFRAAVEWSRLDLSFEFIPFSGTYNDLIMSVYDQTFDAAVGDITITSNRSQYVDFTLPYTDLGVAMVGKLDVDDPWFFLKPLDTDLWIMSGCWVIATGLVVWLVEHRDNEKFQGTISQQIGTSLWFAASTLVYAHREKLKSNLSRFVVSTWLFVVLILTSSYVATLSSLLTVKQIRLFKDDHIGYSSAMLQNHTVNNLNFTDHRSQYYHSAKEYDDALRLGSDNGGVAAIIDEMPYIQLVLGHYPSDYTIVSSSMTTNGFAFAFQKGSPLVHEISRAIAELREKGKLQEMEKKWYASQSSDMSSHAKRDQTNSIGLGSFSWLFVISGISKAIAILLFTIFLLWEYFEIENYVRIVFPWVETTFILKHFFPPRADAPNELIVEMVGNPGPNPIII